MKFNPKISISFEAAQEVAKLTGDNCPAEIADALDRYNEVMGDEPLIRNGVTYTKPEHKQFILDAEDAGFDIYLYHGRFYWSGPAVNIEQGDSGFTSSVKTQQDGMGLGKVIYPVVSDSSLKNVHESD